ncbi:hypothetical protein [Macrococcus sp. DPC7161]|uniref:hypothetical protein n=1 Tax=Macrococcus sp. DPC7161 TaxID=2507060 RepID=UPI00100AF412|nr:hypothetical protein [Macrococcus sp. DPC7161]RXK17369.1 hypothetical protein ER639_10315 [Macrococcus sp. DPC7161]
MFELFQEIFWGCLLSALLLSVSFVMIFRERFSKDFQEKYLSYWQLRQTFMAWIVFLPVGLMSFFHTLKRVIQFIKLMLYS